MQRDQTKYTVHTFIYALIFWSQKQKIDRRKMFRKGNIWSKIFEEGEYFVRREKNGEGKLGKHFRHSSH